MTTVIEHIQSTDEAICRNIRSLRDQRALLSQNLLAQLRNLVEGVAVRLHAGRDDTEYNYAAINPGLDFVKAKGKLNFLGKFHKLIQISASHYTVDGDASERLMLKYYEYLLRIRDLLRDSCGIAVLANLESFPVDLDPSLREYHEKIAARIVALRSTGPGSGRRDRYYIHKTRPFFVSGRIYLWRSIIGSRALTCGYAAWWYSLIKPVTTRFRRMRRRSIGSAASRIGCVWMSGGRCCRDWCGLWRL